MTSGLRLMFALLALAFLPLLIKSDFALTILVFSFLLGMLAVSFNLIFGYTGQLSMFHAAAFGISASKASGLRAMFLTHPPLEDRIAALRAMP